MHSRSVATANSPQGPQDCCRCKAKLRMALVLARKRVLLSSPACKGMCRWGVTLCTWEMVLYCKTAASWEALLVLQNCCKLLEMLS